MTHSGVAWASHCLDCARARVRVRARGREGGDGGKEAGARGGGGYSTVIRYGRGAGVIIKKGGGGGGGGAFFLATPFLPQRYVQAKRAMGKKNSRNMQLDRIF